MKEQTLFLIFTPIDRRYKDADSHYSPPLGLVALKNFLSQTKSDLNIVLLDGSVCHSKTEIIDLIHKIRPNFVGQSIQLLSYENCIDIAKAAKSINATTIVGGHHATQMRKEIAINKEGIIDFVIFGDGEVSLYGLLSGQSLQTIPNIAYCHKGVYFENKAVNIPFYQLPTTNYSDINLQPYQALLKSSQFNISSNKTYLRIYSHKGCGNRGGSEACIFCGRADKNVRLKDPKQYWADIKTVVDMNGADYIFDVGDDFMADENWIKKITANKPPLLHEYQMGIFGRANRITEKKAALLKNLNIKDVVIGFETGDPVVMANVGKKETSVAISQQAAKILFDQDIDVCASFVLGLPGETDRSLESTIRVASDIVDLSLKIRGVKPREVVANLLEPSPGSPAFRYVVNKYPEKYKGKDLLSLEELQYDYFRAYFGIDTITKYETVRKKLRETAIAIHSMVNFADSQGWLLNEVSHNKN